MENKYNNYLIPTLVSVIPDLVGGQGHVYSYHQAVGKAATLLGWKYLVALAPDPRVKDIPSNWYPCLSSDNLEWEVPTFFKIFKIYNIYIWSNKLTKYLKQEVLLNSQYTIIFIERFIILHLIALTISLLVIPKKNLSVWLLYRRDTHNQKNRFIYKIFNKIIKNILFKGNLRLLSDSENLSKSLSNYFAEPVSVIPIPHTDVICNDTFPRTTDEILCWWVGSPRAEKGLAVIKNLVNSEVEGATKVCLIAAQSSNLTSISGGVKIKLVQDNLNRKEYLKWLATCDICLLPYSQIAYQERTSGILVECIIAGKIPLVTNFTWMAMELSKYSLEELILKDTSPEIIIESALKFSKSSTIINKLKIMQKEYIKFHSVQGYAENIKMLLK